MATDGLDRLLAEQMAYYRARAAEYDATSPIPADDESRRELVDALEAFAPRGRVLEFACGTGQWTATLAKHASDLTAIDGAREMLAIAADRVRDHHVRFIETDIFKWQPDRRYDVLFFSAWLSHVPPSRFERFWELAANCLGQNGRVFFIDELPAAAVHEQTLSGAGAPVVERSLRSGARHRTVKVFYEPDELEERLTTLGWNITVQPVGWRFFHAAGHRERGSRD